MELVIVLCPSATTGTGELVVQTAGERRFVCFHRLLMPITRLFAFIIYFLEFTGSYIQTKSGDEKCHPKKAVKKSYRSKQREQRQAVTEGNCLLSD